MARGRCFFFFLTCPPSLCIPIPVSLSATSYVFSSPLPPPLAVPSARSPTEVQHWTVKELTETPVLWISGWARRAPGIRQRASELREQSCPCNPSCTAHIRPRAANPAYCSGKVLWVCFGLSADKTTLSNPFFPPLHLAASSHFSWPVTPYWILCYIAVLIGVLYSNFLAIFQPY